MSLSEQERQSALDTLLRTWSVPLATRLENGEGVGPHLYVLGCLEHRVTILAQQVRALNLVAALESRANLSPVAGKSLAVVGAGIAGTTAALAAQRAGFRVHLFERYLQPFQPLRSGQTRWLHPHIYDWPNPGWENPSADLPVLTWEAGSAAEVVEQLDRQWQASQDAEAPVTFHAGVANVVIRGYEWESAEHVVAWEAEDGRLLTGRYNVVVLALGFGEERDVPDVKTTSYWQDFGFVVRPRQRLHILVVGDGDGGLIDTLRARFKNFRQEALPELLKFEGHEALEREVASLEYELAQNRLRPLELAHRYGRLPSVEALDTALARHVRNDTRVTIVGRSPNMMNPRSTPLHRLLVQRLVARDKGVEFHETSVTRITPPTAGRNKFRAEFKPAIGASADYDQVVVRAGPASALEASFPQIHKAMAGSYASLLSTRLPPRLWTDPSSASSPVRPPIPGPNPGVPVLSEGQISEVALLEVLNKLEQKWPDPQAGTLGFKMVQRELDLIKRDPAINRAYAIDHFDPTIWAAPRAYYWLALQCRRFLKENFVSIPPPPRWDIVFSEDVLSAIVRSIQNIERMPKRPRGGFGASLTHFDDTPVANRPHQPDPDIPRFEVARILIWPPEWLREGFVEHLIRMHGAFNVPLFFIDRKWVEDRGISLEVEYLLLCTREHDRSLNAHGLDGSEWPRNPGEPRPIKETNLDKPLDHFLSLLECEELLFAADAYKIVREGHWDAYTKIIRKNRT